MIFAEGFSPSKLHSTESCFSSYFLKGFPIPAKWSPMPLENGREKTVHLVTLSTDSHEYKNVLKIFGRASDPRFPAYFELPELFIKSCRQIKIQRIQSPHLYQQYIAYKKKMEKDNGRKFNERRLFHGTIERNVKAINTQGFNRTFCGANGRLNFTFSFSILLHYIIKQSREEKMKGTNQSQLIDLKEKDERSSKIYETKLFT